MDEEALFIMLTFSKYKDKFKNRSDSELCEKE